MSIDNANEPGLEISSSSRNTYGEIGALPLENIIEPRSGSSPTGNFPQLGAAPQSPDSDTESEDSCSAHQPLLRGNVSVPKDVDPDERLINPERYFKGLEELHAEIFQASASHNWRTLEFWNESSKHFNLRISSPRGYPDDDNRMLSLCNSILRSSNGMRMEQTPKKPSVEVSIGGSGSKQAQRPYATGKVVASDDSASEEAIMPTAKDVARDNSASEGAIKSTAKDVACDDRAREEAIMLHCLCECRNVLRHANINFRRLAFLS